MRIVMMGNGPFAQPALQAVCDHGSDIALVVARPDRPQGKKRRIIPGPVATLARQLGLPLEQPESVNDPDYVDRLRALNADLLIVADFGQLLSADCLATTKYGGINIHASLLPKYRGAAPVAWAIYHGETETGVSIIQMSPKLDAGAVIAQERLDIGPNETAGQLEARLARMGAELVVGAADAVAQSRTRPIPQDPKLATKAPRLNKEDGKIDWARSAIQLHNQVRAMQPWPIAYTELRNADGSSVRIQLLETEPAPKCDSGRKPGFVVEAGGGRLVVQTGVGGLGLKQIKPAGKKAMSVGEFLRGRPINPGDVFS